MMTGRKGKTIGLPATALAILFLFPGCNPQLVKSSVPETSAAVAKITVARQYELNEQGIRFGKGFQIEQAIKAYREAIELDPKHAEAYNGLGYLYLHKGKPLRAEENFKKAISKNRRYPEAWINLGVVYYQKEEYAKAIKKFEKAISYAPGSSEAFRLLGCAYYKEGELEKAEEALKTSLMYTKSADAHNSLGVVYMEKGLYEDAVLEFKKALRITPSHTNALQNLSAAMMRAQGAEKTEN